MRRRKVNKLQANKINDEKRIEMDSLLFVYDTTVEKQQFPIPVYPASCPTSPPSYCGEVKRSLSHLELSQCSLSPDLLNLRRGSLDPRELDLRLYQMEEEVSTSPYMGLGRLSLSMNYDQSNEKLNVHIHRGVNIQAKHISATPSPYLKLCLLPDKKRRMHSKTRKGESPLFNEEFIFSVPKSELSERTLRIAVCDFDRFSRQNVLGYVVIPLQDEMNSLMQPEQNKELWVELSDTDVAVCKAFKFMLADHGPYLQSWT